MITSSPVATAARSPILPQADDAAEVELALPPRHLDARHLHRRARNGCVQRVHSLQQLAELEAPEDLLQLRAIRRVEHELSRVAVDIEVAAHRRELLRRARELRVLGDVARTRRRELRGVLDHGLERSVLRDQLPGRLVADARDARDVVGRVALEADEVGHLLGRHAVPGLDALRRVDVDVGDAARGHHQADVVAAQLEGVTIGGDDARLDPGRIGAGRERRDHVVRLPALELEVPVAECLDDRPEVRELLAEQVGHRPPALLVDHLRCLGDRSPMDRPGVPRNRDALGAVVREQLEQHVREPEQCTRRLTIGRGQLLRQREERAIGEIVAVDDEEIALARRRVVQLQLGSGQCFRHSPRVSS